MSTHLQRRDAAGPNSAYYKAPRDCDLPGRACAGTACFVARYSCGETQLDGDPRACCLGR